MTTRTVTTRVPRLIDHPPHRPPSLGEVSQRVWSTISKMVVPLTNPWSHDDAEPVIEQKSDRHGNAYWTVYDPPTNRTVYCMCESEVWLWLDQQVYRVPR